MRSNEHSLTVTGVVNAAISRSLLLDSLDEGGGLAHGLHRAQSGVLLLQCLPPHFLALLLETLVALGEVGESERSVSVSDGLQDGVVDEGILRLWQRERDTDNFYGLHFPINVDILHQVCLPLYLSLDHIVAMLPHSAHKPSDINDAICLQLCQAVVDAYDGAAPTDTCTAVHQNGPRVGRVGGVECPQEVEERGSEFRGSVVGPLGVVELEDHLALGRGYLGGRKDG